MVAGAAVPGGGVAPEAGLPVMTGGGVGFPSSVAVGGSAGGGAVLLTGKRVTVTVDDGEAEAAGAAIGETDGEGEAPRVTVGGKAGGGTGL